MNIPYIKDQLQQGGIIITPTDTCYGFSCFYDSKEGIKNIQNIKGRVQDKPFSLLFSSIDQVKQFCEINKKQEDFISNNIYKSSFVVRKKNVETGLIASLQEYFPNFDTVSIRIENDSYVFCPVKIFGKPLITTSVNISGKEILHNPVDIKNEFGKYSFVHFLFFDNFKSGEASSIWDLTLENYAKLR